MEMTFQYNELHGGLGREYSEGIASPSATVSAELISSSKSSFAVELSWLHVSLTNISWTNELL